jgi:hypothetical protein
MLRAGPLSVRYLDGDLRDIRLGDIEVIRRTYMVFQDRNWTARPWMLEREQIDDQGDEFTIEVQGHGTFDATPFGFTTTMTGGRDGTITYQVTGRTTAPFLRNRMGISVLHPMKECAGQVVTIEHSDGSIEATKFPQAISPHQPFLDIRAMTHQVLPELFATIRLSGETFEAEDHRNWSDASFKTYCTPITLPFPVTVQPSDLLEQQVTLRLEGATTATIPPLAEPMITMLGPAQPIPGIGLQIPPGTTTDLTEDQVAALKVLRLHHLRVDIDCANPDARQQLSTAIRQCEQLDTALWVALFATTAQDVAPLINGVSTTDLARIDRWLIFDPDTKVTPAHLVEQVRTVLHATGGEVRLFSGSNLYYTELNREPLDAATLNMLDGVTFSVNPQVHASDDWSVLQNTAGLGAIANDAPRLAGRLPIVISPLTLRPRFNPNATAPEFDYSNTALPSAVDARQRTDFAAIWALLSVKALSAAGTIDAVTIGQTIGWQGVMADPDGSPDPEHFPARPNERFPIWQALQQLSNASHLFPTTTSRPDAVQALILQGPSTRTLVLINLTDEPQLVRMDAQCWDLAPHAMLTCPL